MFCCLAFFTRLHAENGSGGGVRPLEASGLKALSNITLYWWWPLQRADPHVWPPLPFHSFLFLEQCSRSARYSTRKYGSQLGSCVNILFGIKAALNRRVICISSSWTIIPFSLNWCHMFISTLSESLMFMYHQVFGLKSNSRQLLMKTTDHPLKLNVVTWWLWSGAVI